MNCRSQENYVCSYLSVCCVYGVETLGLFRTVACIVFHYLRLYLTACHACGLERPEFIRAVACIVSTVPVGLTSFVPYDVLLSCA